ncbi:MAG: hypothetical protein AB7G37_13665 [Solirubrobacteraceae bacterium]
MGARAHEFDVVELRSAQGRHVAGVRGVVVSEHPDAVTVEISTEAELVGGLPASDLADDLVVVPLHAVRIVKRASVAA